MSFIKGAGPGSVKLGDALSERLLTIGEEFKIMIYFIAGTGLAFLVSAVYAQSALSELMDFFRDSPSLLEKTGFISDLYFLADLTMCRYGFVRYLLKHPVPPKEIADAFPDYSRLRNISNVVYGLHIALGIVLIISFVMHQL